jgi:AraC-like DNA-binding protein
MSDFAATAMMRMIQAGLKRQSISLAQPRIEARRIDAHLPLDHKRAALVALHSAYGIDSLLRIGEAVDDVVDEPALTALLLAQDPMDLLTRWQRLERFIHSRHRIALTIRGECSVLVRHHSIRTGAPPLPAEDALVFGLLVRLIERIGANALRARPEGSHAWARTDERWRPLPKTQSLADLAVWEFIWSGGSHCAPSPTTLNDAESIAAQLTRLMTSDPNRIWTVSSAANTLLTSSRTLQRRLHAEGASFQRLLRESRIAVAAKLLVTNQSSLAEVGYRSGFADQSHFQREFRTATAMTPAQYRESFLAKRGYNRSATLHE